MNSTMSMSGSQYHVFNSWLSPKYHSLFALGYIFSGPRIFYRLVYSRYNVTCLSLQFNVVDLISFIRPKYVLLSDLYSMWISVEILLSLLPSALQKATYSFSNPISRKRFLSIFINFGGTMRKNLMFFESWNQLKILIFSVHLFYSILKYTTN